MLCSGKFAHGTRPKWSGFHTSTPRLHTPRVAAPQQQAPLALDSARCKEVVDRLLERIKDSDGGAALSQAEQSEVNGLLDELEELGRHANPKPLKNPLLVGNYDVAYTSTARAPNERGSPSGGRFRGRVGKMLFQTRGLFQSVLAGEPAPLVTNKVGFCLFGLFPGSVGLRGRVEPVNDDDATVKVLFDPPVLSLGEAVHMRIGPPSSVQLTTTYLDERIRIGKGGRGSLFVFTRGGASDEAGMDRIGLQATSKAALMVFSVCFAAIMGGGLLLWGTGNPLARAAACLIWLVGAGIAGVVQQGGIIRDDDTILSDTLYGKSKGQAQAQAQPQGA